MNPRTTTTVIGLITLVLGVLALFYPELVMSRVLGFAVRDSFSANFVRGEVRAVYGGLFTVLGTFTVLAAMDLAASRSRLVFIATLWLGLCGGRMFGVFAEGNPGLYGWLSLAFEGIVGGLLLVASQITPKPASLPAYEPAPSAPPVTAPPPPPATPAP